MPGRGLLTAGAFGVRALTDAAALELREKGRRAATHELQVTPLAGRWVP